MRSPGVIVNAIEPLNSLALWSDALAGGAGGDGLGFFATLDSVQHVDPLFPFSQWARIFAYSVAGMRVIMITTIREIASAGRPPSLDQ